MTHDPLCPIAEGECPGRDRPHFIAEGDTWCGGCQVDCQCDLIARVRADTLNSPDLTSSIVLKHLEETMTRVKWEAAGAHLSRLLKTQSRN